MKKKIIILVAAFCGMMSVANAQLYVGNGGNVGIGYLSVPENKFHVIGRTYLEGDFCLKYNAPAAAFRLTAEGYETAFIPGMDAYNKIGTSTKKIYQIHTYNLYYSSLYQISDLRVKENLQLLNSDNSISRINKIKVYQYDFNEKICGNMKVEENPNSFGTLNKEDKTSLAASLFQKKEKIRSEGKNQTGVMAQELKEIFPELVNYDEKADLYSVNYVGLIPHMLLTIQEQSKEIESLKSQLTFMQLNCCNSFIKDPKPIKDITKSGSQNSTQTQVENNAARLDQNIPNPFTENTKISFFVPKPAQTAQLCIYDLTGKQLKQLSIAERGETSVSIRGQELQAGIYLYALLVDGQLVDSKKMVLTK